MKPKPKRLRGVLLLTPVLVGLTVFFLFRLPAWRRFELITYDWRMKKTGPKPVSGNVVIVFIGDETLKLLGRWPLPRNWYASLTEVLKAWGARVVAYDILFLEESGDRVADRQFGEAVTRAGNVIHSCYFQGEIATRRGVLSGEHLLLPPEVLGQATAIGFVNTPPDDDGITRRYPFFANHQGRLIPSLGLAILKEYYQLPGSAIKMGNSHTLTVTVKGQPHLIPVDQTGSAWLTIYPDLKMFPHYAMVQVLQSYAAWSRGKKSSLSPEAFTDKIVLVAHTAAGTTDIGPVAGRERYLKVGLHASFLESFFHDDFIRPAGTSISLMAPVCGALAAAGAAAAFPPLVGFIFTCLLGCLFILVAGWLFSAFGLWIEMVPGTLSLFVTSLTTTLSQFVAERREKNKLRVLFQRYIAPPVLERLLTSGAEITLGGEKRVLTVLFADVRGFTPLAEKISPEKSVELLNEMFGILEEAIFSYGGTVDKFMGDAIMAIYGAPVEQEDHAQRAVFSAVKMVKDLKNRKPGLPLMVGVGLHTGPMVVGNIGTVRRMEYTAIGDAVNLASRIENLAAAGEILISEATYALVKDKVVCEPLGPVTVKGRQEPINLYRVCLEPGTQEGGAP